MSQSETKRRLLLSKWRCREDDLRAEIEELEAQVEATDAGTVADYESTLEVVKYWMHDVYVHRRPMSDPRRILQLVERTLDP